MHLVFHAGAHFAEDKRVLECLLRNKTALAEESVCVPELSRYRRLFHHGLAVMENASKYEDSAGDVLLDSILKSTHPKRVVFSDANFLGPPQSVLRNGILFPKAPGRVADLDRLFPGHEVELFIGIRNPATFLPFCVGETKHRRVPSRFSRLDPRSIRWSECLRSLRAAAPLVRMTVWCNEDAPLLWWQIIREMSGVGEDVPLSGVHALAAELMDEEGRISFEAELAKHDTLTDCDYRNLSLDYLSRYAMRDEIEEEIDLPGFSAELVEEITDIYERDTGMISCIPGVRLLTV